MKVIRIPLAALLLINVCYAQGIKKIYSDTSIIYAGIESICYPDNNSCIEISVTDVGIDKQHNNLSDEITGIYYRFTYGDTINEFIHNSDSTFYFRQLVNDTLNIRGNFIRESKFYRYDKCNLGEYLSELVIIKYDVLRMQGRWYFTQNSLYGNYSNGAKDGEWRTYYWDKEVEKRYKLATVNNYVMNELESIFNPSNTAVKNNYSWVENNSLSICLNQSESISEADTIYVYRNIEDCSEKKLNLQYSNSHSSENIDLNSWDFNEFRGIDIVYDSIRDTYRIVFIDKHKMKLEKLRKASR